MLYKKEQRRNQKIWWTEKEFAEMDAATYTKVYGKPENKEQMIGDEDN